MDRQRRFPYRIAVEFSEEDEAYIARVPVLPGCAAHGDTAEQATREALDAAEGILASMTRHGRPPPPSDLDRGHSGNIRLRLPRYLHARLARRADVEGVSLNQLMVALLAEQGRASGAVGAAASRGERGVRPAER